jgi:hypothetical protein
MAVPPEQSGGQNSAYRSGCHLSMHMSLIEDRPKTAVPLFVARVPRNIAGWAPGLFEFTVRAKFSQAVFSQRCGNRIKSFFQHFTDLLPQHGARIGLMYLLKWSG